MTRSAIRMASVGLLMALPVLVGCPTGAPGLAVYPSAFNFGASLTSDVFTVSSQSDAPIAWEVQDLPSFLSVSPSSGSAVKGGTQVTLTLNRSGLASGNYKVEFKVAYPGGSRTIPVAFSVDGPPLPPTLAVTPAALDFDAATSSRTLTVTNSGGGTITWNATPADNWISLSTSSGSVDGGGDSDTVTVNVNRTGLAAGTYSSEIPFVSNGGVVTVPVTAVVQGAAATLSISPVVLDFGTTTQTRTLTIANPGTAALDWTLTESLPWLALSQTSGTTPAAGSSAITVTVDRSALATGPFSGDITCASNGGNATVAVTMTVASTQLSVNPLQLQFGSYATSKLVAIGNDGNGTINWSINTSGLPSWLSVAPTSGSVTSGTQGVLVSVDRSGLTPGNRTAQIPISSNGGNATVTVNMNVAAVPVLTIQTGFLTSNDLPLVVLGADAVEAQFTIRNTGTGTLSWNIDPTSFPAWLSMTPVAGAITTGTTTVKVTVNRANLAPGGYSFNVPVTSNGGLATMEVTMQVPLRPAIAADTSEIKLGLDGNSSTFNVANVGDVGTVLNFRVESDKQWLFFSPGLGTSIGVSGPFKDWQLVNISVDRGNLESTGSTGTLTIRALDPSGNVRQDIAPATVKVSVEASPLSFEGAIARLHTPSMVRFVQIMRDFRDRSIVATPQELAGAFSIVEDGVPLELTETNIFITNKYRVNALILLDFSGSMKAAADSVAGANPQSLRNIYVQQTGAFINSLPAEWRVAIMEFHERGTAPTLVQNFTTDRAALLSALANINVADFGATALLPAVEAGMGQLLAEDSPYIPFDDADVKALCVITDGRRTTPPGEVQETADRLAAAKVRVFSIGWGQDVNNEPLARLSSESGGHYYSTRPTTSGGPDIAELQNRLAVLSQDLQNQIVLSYTTLNEEDNVPVRVNATFNPSTDTPDQGILQGTFQQELDLNTVIGDVRLGQIAMRTTGIANGTARVYLRLDYAPRNVNKFRFTLQSTQAFTVTKVPNADGGLVESWNLADLGGGVYSLTAPLVSNVLPYGSFGELLAIDFPSVNVNEFTLELDVDDSIYFIDLDPKYFIHPDVITVNQQPMTAPALPTPLISPKSFSFGDSTNVDTLTIRNIGGSYSYTGVDFGSMLNWVISDKPSWISVNPEDGVIESGLISDQVTLTVDRSIKAGYYASFLTLGYQAIDLNVTGATLVPVTMLVLPPVMSLDKNVLNFGAVQTNDFVTITNTGQSTLVFTVDSAALPAWLNVLPLTGGVASIPAAVEVKVNRTGLPSGNYNHDLVISSNGGTETVTITMTVP